jgi:UDP-N-acetylglucosamine--N-acetylmuramyl-(pentapeptide) pyrophosphoryl-undecaprenol N-acetylglucosamine transferase
MRVILTGGGTGGHIYPAIAIGQAIFKEWPRTEFLYVGTEAGLEKRILSSTRFPFISIDVEGIQRKVSIQVFRAAWKALIGLQQAERIIHDFVPHLVIGTGGYVCLPMVWGASRRGIPTIIHEQNALPGLTNRFLSRRVNEILLTFPEAKERLAKHVQFKSTITGLPIREEILQVTRQEGLDYFGFSSDKKTLLSLGGSRGALSINKAMLHIYKELKNKVQIVHITGVNGYDSFMRELKNTSINVGNCGNIIIRPYLHHMEYALACADLCVGRAGAAFLSEMTAMGIPGVLIPYPYAAENHQEYNAKALSQNNAAVMLLDKDLSGEALLKQVSELIFNDQRRNLMAENSKKAGNIEAIEKIIEVIRPYMYK